MGGFSLFLGILCLVIDFFCGGILGWLAVILSLIGIILGVVGRKRAPVGAKGTATAGIVCCVISLILGVFMFFACSAMFV